MRARASRLRALGGLFAASLAVLTGCGPTESAPSNEGTVVLRFSVSDSVRTNMNLQDPLLGGAYGSLFYREDVGAAGPHDGVEEVASVELTGVDLRTADTSEQTWKSGPLEAREYAFLGMLDLDGNSDPADRVPDAGDLVMLGTTNHFEVIEGEETEAVILFNLLYN